MEERAKKIKNSTALFEHLNATARSAPESLDFCWERESGSTQSRSWRQFAYAGESGRCLGKFRIAGSIQNTVQFASADLLSAVQILEVSADFGAILIVSSLTGSNKQSVCY